MRTHDSCFNYHFLRQRSGRGGKETASAVSNDGHAVSKEDHEEASSRSSIETATTAELEHPARTSARLDKECQAAQKAERSTGLRYPHDFSGTHASMHDGHLLDSRGLGKDSVHCDSL